MLQDKYVHNTLFVTIFIKMLMINNFNCMIFAFIHKIGSENINLILYQLDYWVLNMGISVIQFDEIFTYLMDLQ